MCLLPQVLGDRQCVDLDALPPGNFVARLMQLPVMAAAQRYGELVADLQADGSGLREPQVMRIGGLSAADEAGLRGDELQMRLVTQPLRLGDGELALVDRRRE